ncbi:MAG: hypothetical protein QXS21_04805 [Thermoproteota archaeon]|nr:COG1361 S-layer family protein [Candidatus Brockarchaeota archaeon]MBO3767968.1 COG1361 S-layer family protein [Candidatus Brockarchaeota archaeon]MBO3801820.1 COG1361 S-layer family protein [Candidatus Brockarchaeota archaeon]
MMNTKYLVVTALLAYLFVFGSKVAAAPTISISGSTWGSLQVPLSAEPGSQLLPFSIYITNIGKQTAYNAYVTIYPSYPLSSQYNTENISFILPGSTVPATFYLSVAPNSSTGVYSLPVKIEYEISGYKSSFDYTLSVPVTTFASLHIVNVQWGSGSLLAYPSAKGLPLIVELKNVGTNNAYNTSVTLIFRPPFYYTINENNTTIYVANETNYVGLIPPGATIPVQFTLNIFSNATIGTYPVNFIINYNGGIQTVETANVSIFGSPQVIVQGYALSNSRIFPGDSNIQLILSVVNSGNVTENQVNVSLFPFSPLSLSSASNSYTIGILPPGQPVQLTYLLNVYDNASSPMTASVLVRITYGNLIYEKVLQIPVAARANFTVNYKNDSLFQGDSNIHVVYMVKNVGNETARDVQAQLILPSTLSGNVYNYLGDIPPSSTALLTFSLDVSSDAPPGTYQGTIVLTWDQNGAPGVRFLQRIPVKFEVKPGFLTQLESAVSTTLYSGIGILVIIVLVAVVVLVRKRR